MSVIRSGRVDVVWRASASHLATTYGPPPDKRPHVIVRLSDDNGCVGWGEATPLPAFTGETADSIRLALERELLPALAGLPSGDFTEAQRRMERALYGNTAAKAAADMALYDLAARAAGLPEYAFLGGVCRRSVGVNRHIGIMPAEQAVRLASGYAAAGFRTLKMKAGVDPDEDICRIKAVRQAVGGDMAIRVDANQGYDFATAWRVLSALRDEELQYFEQPLPRWDWRGLQALRQSGVPIGADESLHSVRDAVVLAENRCVDVFVLKLIKTGGLRPALDIVAIAAAAGIRCVVTSVFDTQLGAAHCLQLAAALPETLSCDLTCYASQPEWGESCHRLENGALTVGAGAGCGVTKLRELELAAV